MCMEKPHMCEECINSRSALPITTLKWQSEGACICAVCGYVCLFCTSLLDFIYVACTLILLFCFKHNYWPADLASKRHDMLHHAVWYPTAQCFIWWDSMKHKSIWIKLCEELSTDSSLCKDGKRALIMLDWRFLPLLNHRVKSEE